MNHTFVGDARAVAIRLAAMYVRQALSWFINETQGPVS